MSNEQDIGKEWDIDNIPNRLTIFRVALVPILMICLGAGLFDNISLYFQVEWRKSLTDQMRIHLQLLFHLE